MKKLFLLSCLLVSASVFGMNRAYPNYFNKQIVEVPNNAQNQKNDIFQEITKSFGNDFLNNVKLAAKNMQQSVEDIFKKENK